MIPNKSVSISGRQSVFCEVGARAWNRGTRTRLYVQQPRGGRACVCGSCRVPWCELCRCGRLRCGRRALTRRCEPPRAPHRGRTAWARAPPCHSGVPSLHKGALPGGQGGVRLLPPHPSTSTYLLDPVLGSGHLHPGCPGPSLPAFQGASLPLRPDDPLRLCPAALADDLRAAAGRRRPRRHTAGSPCVWPAFPPALT